MKGFIYRNTPGVWKRIVHPEGARYFFNPHKVRASAFGSLVRSSLVTLQQVFTDMDLTQQNSVEIDECIDFLREKENGMVPGSLFQETRTQLVIQLNEEDSDEKWLYYFVNHGTRVVFWVDEFKTEDLSAFDDLKGVTATSHISESLAGLSTFLVPLMRCRIRNRVSVLVSRAERTFQTRTDDCRMHCEQYPNCNSVSQDHVTEFTGMIAHACAGYFHNTPH